MSQIRSAVDVTLFPLRQHLYRRAMDAFNVGLTVCYILSICNTRSFLIYLISCNTQLNILRGYSCYVLGVSARHAQRADYGLRHVLRGTRH